MSGPPQTPIRYAQNQQFMARPGTPGQQIQMSTPTGQQQRPMMQFRPGMPMQAHTPQQQQQQQQMLMAGMGRGVQLTPQQQAHYNQQLQQHYYQQQQQQQQQQIGAQMLRPGMAHAQANAGMRPGFPQQPQPQQQQQQSPFAYTGTTSIAVNGVGISGQQGHPALIQPQTPTQGGRKRKSTKAAQDTAAATSEEAGGDELDNIQASSISLGRYQNNHNLMAEIFVALPTSTINVPKHYYEDLDADTLDSEVERLSESVEECKKTHAQRMETMKQDRDEFTEMIQMLTAKGSDANEIKRTVEERFGMEFVDNPYRVIERVPVDSIDSPEGAVYKQL
ncbi:hypothetical protein COEREDRAFT_87540 [Coemansia reversa NRRL 1564]|uniref:Uncharacterized protein n=1 Tax=Coemansia reversa (strain ATCC 12441 / NRRL 1564) TaxID=763665 RepID=A0A2G5B9X4_COERN|nr:hypothetical protein COEREDRAFT_87540 [Coemansia reversa NRRL 1564]|eukprot:PIA15790.1 hypothetical protein COEREDRAFT_87540 [Coemansia reversa NRRL 1564]